MIDSPNSVTTSDTDPPADSDSDAANEEPPIGAIKIATDAVNGTDVRGDFSVELEVDEMIKRKRNEIPNLSRGDELELAIEFCKSRLKECELLTDKLETQKLLMEKLVDCRYQLELLKEEADDPEKMVDANRVLTVRHHEFVLQSASGRNPYCEVCMSTVWRFVQRWRRCKACGFRSHEKCVNSTQRVCAAAKARHPLFRARTEICEEHGLDSSKYSCAECHHPLQFGGSADSEPRLCDYNGRYYCPRCHWNDEWMIPARVIHNWDTEKYKVCRASKQLLSIIDSRPLYNISQLNPAIIKFVSALNEINKLRRNILLMKCYFICCKEAKKLRILQHLNRRQHFVESAEWYSLADLRDLAEGRLLPEIEQITAIFSNHITRDCIICQGNGFICELCTDTNVIFPFSEGVAICCDCCAVFHEKCFQRASKHCPRCFRRKQRAPPGLSVDESDA